MDPDDISPTPDQPQQPEQAQADQQKGPVKYAWVPDFIARHMRGSSVRARLVKGVAWSSITGVATRGIFVLLSVIVARILGKEEFGKWGMVQATVGVLSVLAGMRIGQVLTKHLAELRHTDKQRAGRIFALGAQLAVLSNLVIAAGCLCSAGIIAARLLDAPEMTWPIALSSLIAVTTGLALLLQSSLAGFEAFKQIAYVRFVGMLATFIAMVLLTKAMGLIGAILGFSLGQTVSIALFTWILVKLMRANGIPVRLKGAWGEIGILWHYSLPSLLASLATAPANWYALAMVKTNYDFTQMSGYTAAQRLRGMVGFVPRHIRLVVLPVMSQLKGAGDLRRYRKAFLANVAVTFAVGLLAAVPLAVCSRWVMSFYGSEYVGDWDVLVVLLGVSVIQGVLGIFGQLFVSERKVWWSFYVNLMWAAALTVGAVQLVPKYGIRGFVWPLLGAYAISLFMHCIFARVLLSRQERVGSGEDEPAE